MTDEKVEKPMQASFPREELSTKFDQATTTVRLYTNRIENDVCRPIARYFFDTYQERPILATFLATLAILSYIPVLAFFAASSCTLIFALVISLSAGFAVILVLFCVLISTLAASVFVAAVITAACLYIYLAFRLVSLVRQYGASKGILCWIDEIWKHTSAIGSMTLPLPFRRQVNSAAIQHQQPSYESTEDSDLDTKVEG